MPLISRRELLQLAAAGAAGGALLAPEGAPASAQEAGAAPDPFHGSPLIPAPQDPGEWPAFRGRLAAWRREVRERLRYDDALYRRPDFAWVPSCFSCGFLMLCDEALYDPKRGRYTLDAFLRREGRELGGYDAVVLWHAYPRIGLDDRNQFDFYRDMPGGLKGLRELVRDFHRRGIRVFVDYNPWDTGTRREPVSDLEALAELVGALEADGIFLDTMDRGAPELRAKLDAVRPGVALESEIALPLERLHDHHLSWAQWFQDSHAPGILRNKWVERRHMQHQIHRWSRDHTAELHGAWMNGSGMMVWENVFGSWVGWCARDRSLLRAMLPLQRRYADLFAGEGWTPLVPTERPDVFASLWEGRGLRLWTLVNRSSEPVEGPLLRVSPREGDLYHDLIRGRSVRPETSEGSVVLSGLLPPRGLGGFVAGDREALGSDFRAFLARLRRLHARASEDTSFPARAARLRPLPAAPRRAVSEVPAGMAAIPGAELTLEVVFRTRECGFYEPQEDPHPGAPPHPLHQPRVFRRPVKLAPYALDLTPVTNAQYAEFLRSSGYRPRHPERFLHHWKSDTPPPHLADHPVVYVDLDDARAYARWAGKRLPTEEEWQYAAQGPDGRRYPWGDEMRPGLCNDGSTGGTTPVTAFPEGRSPFGVYDLCGNTWEWTESERSDGRTRFAIVRGGSYYRPRGSDWYMDGGPQPCAFAAKVLLMWPGLDRCATVGFRCALSL